MTTQHASPSIQPAASHTGSCLCGGVRFRIDGALAPIQVCHCGQCRKAQGGPLATNIPVSADQVHWQSGRELLSQFESSPEKLRAFCSRCGSPVYSTRSSLPNVLRMRVGLLDEPLEVSIAFHQQVASRAAWWPVPSDDLPQYDAAKPA